MAEITVLQCDACKDFIKDRRESMRITRVVMEGRTFLDAAGGRDKMVLNLDFCQHCSRRLLDSLERIEKMDPRLGGAELEHMQKKWGKS